MATQTPTERRAREVLAEDLWTWVERHLKDGRSWAWLARKLADLSGGDIAVTRQYLNQLYRRHTDARERARLEQELAEARKTA